MSDGSRPKTPIHRASIGRPADIIESTIANEHSMSEKIAELGWNSHVLR
jgi:hypothetical protein